MPLCTSMSIGIRYKEEASIIQRSVMRVPTLPKRPTLPIEYFENPHRNQFDSKKLRNSINITFKLLNKNLPNKSLPIACYTHE